MIPVQIWDLVKWCGIIICSTICFKNFIDFMMRKEEDKSIIERIKDSLKKVDNNEPT